MCVTERCILNLMAYFMNMFMMSVLNSQLLVSAILRAHFVFINDSSKITNAAQTHIFFVKPTLDEPLP